MAIDGIIVRARKRLGLARISMGLCLVLGLVLWFFYFKYSLSRLGCVYLSYQVPRIMDLF